MNVQWKDGEFAYCQQLVCRRGDSNVSHRPETIASYLALQAQCALKSGETEIALRLNAAAAMIDQPDLAPDWINAEKYLFEPGLFAPY